MSFIYQHAILGGTFDHFHVGHEQFVAAPFIQAVRVTIGLVKSPVTKLYPTNIESYAEREISLRSYLDQLKVSERSNIIALRDIYGTSLTDPNIDAIFVTESTQQNAQHINEERVRRKLPILEIVAVDYVQGDDGVVVSSSHIRAGHIDRSGHSYLKSLLQKPTYHLPPSLRQTLQTPLGTIVTNLDELASTFSPSATLISVGDIVSIDLVKAGHHPAICIIDHHTRRQALDQAELAKLFPVAHHSLKNPSGTINSSFGGILLSALAAAKQQQTTQVVAVEGEEDLLALPALLLAPLNSYVVYGQYRVGMCIVKVTKEIKSLAKNLLNEFD